MRSSSENRFVHDPVQIAITQLSDEEIRGLAQGELLEVIRLSRGTDDLEELPESVSSCQSEMLLEVALARRDRCRQALGSAFRQC